MWDTDFSVPSKKKQKSCYVMLCLYAVVGPSVLLTSNLTFVYTQSACKQTGTFLCGESALVIVDTIIDLLQILIYGSVNLLKRSFL